MSWELQLQQPVEMFADAPTPFLLPRPCRKDALCILKTCLILLRGMRQLTTPNPCVPAAGVSPAVVAAAEAYVRKELAATDASHDFAHIQRVRANARNLAQAGVHSLMHATAPDLRPCLGLS